MAVDGRWKEFNRSRQRTRILDARASAKVKRGSLEERVAKVEVKNFAKVSALCVTVNGLNDHSVECVHPPLRRVTRRVTVDGMRTTATVTFLL